MSYSQQWELESIYAGGSDSTQLSEELANVELQIQKLAQSLQADSITYESLHEQVSLVQAVLATLREAESFVSCLMAQNMFDKRAVQLNDRLKQLSAAYTSVLTQFDHTISQIADQQWERFLSQPELEPVAYNLNERRELAKHKMAPELEALAADLAIDGYHGWGDFYNTVVSRMSFKLEDGSELSAGQMANRLDESDRSKREAAFQQWEQGWSEQADLCADTLNHLSGFRLKWYKNRSWHSYLDEPLQMNRMSKQTLDAMWQAVEKGKQLLIPYFERKAKLLGVNKLAWHDVEAPLAASSTTMSFDEAAAFIIEQFGSFSKELADFARMAFENSWIEAEDRPGKRPGGFCTSLPKSKQTRIFMTFSGSASNVSTLAHELGHAYHQHVMKDMPPLTQEYAMNVAETASTFAEMIVSDQALLRAPSKEEKLALVDDKIQRAIAFYMNIHARFIFECSFYERRAEAPLTTESLNELMVRAQKQAFLDLLSDYHPHFWAAKLHFYLTDVPFYNFPYTFGYLFSAGIYKRALAEGESFRAAYDALLQDTGRLMVEELAHKHLGVDLTKPHFWEEAASLVAEDVKLFLELTEQ
ncbi:oligoendopeptidase [Paenibacillus montaniterrae]|uniref:Oligoendopeptidase n=1 Tax=Paenibacillus montaniterrae TaxID=429341 RepID=A0A919YUN5_9BACL|nr:M3 family oligoendopeptidase [Paenibacillus montaniterrae]GIP17163.1 oligoendopeptidase [Paenibacillus montaniterrae]